MIDPAGREFDDIEPGARVIRVYRDGSYVLRTKAGVQKHVIFVSGGPQPMTSIKNEHIVWAYADREDGSGKVVVIGLTALGLQYLRNTPGQTLLVNPPANGFANVNQIVVFHEKDKATLKERFRQAGVPVSEVN